MSLLPSDTYKLTDDQAEIADPHAILLRSHQLHDRPVNDHLLAVARAGAGVNNIPFDQLKQTKSTLIRKTYRTV